MKILYQIPSLNTLYAGRTIYSGYKNAFIDMGHQFHSVTSDDDFSLKLQEFEPDILITALNPFNLKYINLEAIKKARKRKKFKVFVSIPFWNSPLSKLRVNETPSLSQNRYYISLIKSGYFGDVFFNVCEENDDRMIGFEKETGYKHHTILLAADKSIHFPEYNEKFRADISYIGTNLPEKRKFFAEQVYPLRKKYNLKLYGQDWSTLDRTLNFAQKVGQYFNTPILKNFKKSVLQLDDERRIYSSSIISINIHEEYQKKFGGDCNERTFKIPACGGFEITDDVACIRKYFKDGEDIVIAKNKKDWFEKIEYYIKNPQKRDPIIKNGKSKVLKNHTYHNRVELIEKIYKSII